ncbi:5-oxoprolinase subunit B family protein [Nocardioides mangrovicus]|uniref:5-oxoprolinase subunit B family protein n=1 Tax=Nocardioides mangrovicus TaxID=2478913 RepID=UPI0018E0A6D8|nr:allophanate hydrolase subunit 1 [Nocardioides mangrovicus]
MQVHRLGVDALLVECADLAEAMALRAEVERRRIDVRDLVPGARTVLLDGVADRERLAADLTSWPLAVHEAPSVDPVELATVYDGPDLDAVARRWDMSSQEVVATHTGTRFTVAFCGFAPGFGYCVGLPEELAVPRLESPRASVPAGSVGLAGAFTGAYPTASPGGWQLIGRTDAVLWDPSREAPALLAPGTPVRFVRA